MKSWNLPSSCVFFVDEPAFRLLEARMNTHTGPGMVIQVKPVDDHYYGGYKEAFTVSLRLRPLRGTENGCVRVI